MKRIAMATILATTGIAIAGCEPSSEEQAKNAVAEVLRDPDSAKFRHVAASADYSDKNTVCGEVNGKNGFGAYAGYEKFLYYPSGIIYLESTDPEIFIADWISECPTEMLDVW